MLWLEVMVMLPQIYNLYLKEEKRREVKRRGEERMCFTYCYQIKSI